MEKVKGLRAHLRDGGDTFKLPIKILNFQKIKIVLYANVLMQI